MSGWIDKAAVERWTVCANRMVRQYNGYWVRGDDYDALAAHAEKLERERDEALAAESEYRRKNHTLTNERDEARAQAGAIAAEVRELIAQTMGMIGSINYTNVMAIALPTDAAAALARREDEAIEECARQAEQTAREAAWFNDTHGVQVSQRTASAIRALKRSGKENTDAAS